MSMRRINLISESFDRKAQNVIGNGKRGEGSFHEGQTWTTSTCHSWRFFRVFILNFSNRRTFLNTKNFSSREYRLKNWIDKIKNNHDNINSFVKQ